MNKEQHPHPLLSQAEMIEKHGLMVFDDIHSLPLYGEAYTTDYMTVGLNLSGWVKVECDMRPVTFHCHDIAVLTPHHILFAHESSTDYHAELIVMAKWFQEEMKRRYPDIYRDNHHYLYKQDIHLTTEQFTLVHELFQLLRKVCLTNSRRRTELLGDLLKVLFLQLQEYREENGIERHHPTPREELFSRFYQAIEKHYRKNREVRFYAGLCHLSPKHFATVIKEQTDINALEWINSYVTIQAKSLLRHQRQLTVQQVAHLLGFSDQAAFSRYFKKNTGQSPTDYRTST